MKILITGDFVPRNRIAHQIEAGDYSCLEEIKPIIQTADYAIVNFESPVVLQEAKPIEKTGPNLCCTEQAVDCISQAGFKCVTLANNHFRDYGQWGVEDTINTCKKYNIDYVGGGKDLEEASAILYKTINSEKIAIINVCENEWSIATKKYGGSCGMDIVDICHRIQLAKAKTDYVLTIIHGGIELYNLPTPEMKKLYRFLIEMGADAVVNHHQHCYSGYEIHQGKPIFYGLGNLCFDAVGQKDIWNTGFMLSLDITNNQFEIIPYKQATSNHAGIRLVKDKKDFLKNMEVLNSVIGDDDKLFMSYHSYIMGMKPLWKSLLNPYTGKLLNRLVKLRIIPSFIDDTRRNRLYNLVSCESHRGRLLHSLFQEISFEQ